MNRLMMSALIAAGALAASPAWTADVAAGKKIAEASCADCHGDDGKGDDENPSIAGWPVDKFTKAMTEYQDGTNTKDAQMTKAAKKLNAAQVADVAAYYASLPK